ncbi:MAG TPA: hypothetical protein VKI00_27845 [Mycobacterium sp.]|uniref:hypothetical protein n=1 Tax=Mycobacterium sp. TaxID=1785 RepID=UPI002D142210|nr:hypothetical protein [Mycobacterium sp.]HME79333.1 hypothetical protein [Mycobacterium sp.]
MTDENKIYTFSGTHAWHPSVLNDTDVDEGGDADQIIWDIENGFCPRCDRPLPQGRELPAGSRVTACRSIPICGPCGSDEVHEALDGGISGPSWWPIPVEEIDERRERFERHAARGFMTAGPDGAVVITEDGAAPVINPMNTGGWAQYGWADE